VRDTLAPLARKIDLAFVFGSVAQGRETAASDVDVMVLGKLAFASVVGAVTPLRNRLGREINPVVMTKTEFRSKYRAKDRFVLRVAKEPKIFLIGSADEFGKLIENRAA
jgi:predicted nucleotidyltransferase